MRIHVSIQLASILWLFSSAWALTVKDLVTIQGEQNNEISGQGLIVGLQGTGDKKNFLKDDMLKSWLHNSDLDVGEQNFESKNVALVNVSGTIPPHANQGQTIDLTVSTIGDAKSLEGGSLLYTQLHFPGSAGSEQIIFATAQGKVLIVEDQPKTIATVRGTVYTPIPSNIIKNSRMRLSLNKADYVDADRISKQINQHFARRVGHQKTAKALTAGIVEVTIPDTFASQPVSFIAEMKKVPVLFTDVSPKIIIDSRSGMVMLNEKVEVHPFAFSYKDLNVVIGQGPKLPVGIDSQFVQSVALADTQKTDLQNLIDALNAMRVTPKDLAEIIQKAHRIGAIQAELILE